MFDFEIGSAIAGAASDMDALIIGRVIAGVGACGVYIGGMSFFSPVCNFKKLPRISTCLCKIHFYLELPLHGKSVLLASVRNGLCRIQTKQGDRGTESCIGSPRSPSRTTYLWPSLKQILQPMLGLCLESKVLLLRPPHHIPILHCPTQEIRQTIPKSPPTKAIIYFRRRLSCRSTTIITKLQQTTANLVSYSQQLPILYPGNWLSSGKSFFA
jgi:hypothetical protein